MGKKFIIAGSEEDVSGQQLHLIFDDLIDDGFAAGAHWNDCFNSSHRLIDATGNVCFHTRSTEETTVVSRVIFHTTSPSATESVDRIPMTLRAPCRWWAASMKTTEIYRIGYRVFR